MANKIETSSKNIKPRINLNYNMVHLTVQRKVMIPILMFLLVQFLFSSGNHLSLTLNEDPRNKMGDP